MDIWAIVQICINLILLASVLILWARALRSPKEDPRLSRGLQLLQSKISVLEDLSDRTDQQASQLTALIEKKCVEIQKKIEMAESHIESVDRSIMKSREVANIFQDKIPHEEIIQRQRTVEMIKAARLAYQGVSLEDISKQVNLPQGELEFVVKVNRDQLVFNEELLPDWVKVNHGEEFSIKTDSPSADLSHVFDIPETNKDSLKELGDRFREACREQEQKDGAPSRTQIVGQKIGSTLSSVLDGVKDLGLSFEESNRESLHNPVEFEKVEIPPLEEKTLAVDKGGETGNRVKMLAKEKSQGTGSVSEESVGVAESILGAELKKESGQKKFPQSFIKEEGPQETIVRKFEFPQI